MKLLDRSFECLLGFAVLLVLAMMLLDGARGVVLTDIHGRPLGYRSSSVKCPGCGVRGCYEEEYPRYWCRSCERAYRIEFESRRRGDRIEAVRVSARAATVQ